MVMENFCEESCEDWKTLVKKFLFQNWAAYATSESYQILNYQRLSKTKSPVGLFEPGGHMTQIMMS